MDPVAKSLKRSLRAAWEKARNLREFHPPQRFTNYALGRLKSATTGWTPMPLPLTPRLDQRVYNFYLQRNGNGSEVIKLPRGDDAASCRLLRALKSDEVFAEYDRVLRNLKNDPWLRDHCVTVTHVRRDGGYHSEFVEGVNVAQVRDQLLDSDGRLAVDREGLSAGLQRLLENLKGYHARHGTVIGDWAFHNLVYSPEKKAIVNVDARGFCQLPGAAGLEVSHLPAIAANFTDLTDLIQLTANPAPEDAETLAVLRVLDEVRRTAGPYSGLYFTAGYHSLELKGRSFRGQRQCAERLAAVPYDFDGKVVLDLGCNCGGMLHALAKRIRRGFGLDFDAQCVNAANAVKALNQSSNLQFFTFDLDKQDLSLIPCLLLREKVDICFLLAVCMWLQRWRSVIEAASKISKTLLFESNGTPAEQDEQFAELRKHYRQIELLSDTSPDDPLYGNRRLFLCRKNGRA